MTPAYNPLHIFAFTRGRSKHHQRLKRAAARRRLQMLELLESGEYEPKASHKLANALGVDRKTIWRDLQWLKSAGRCEKCGHLLGHPADLMGLVESEE